MTIYRKQPWRADKFAQASLLLIGEGIQLPKRVVARLVSWLLRAEVTSLAQASWMLARANLGSVIFVKISFFPSFWLCF